ncbi:hypothetical protein GCM10010372_59540 [Streptomyces tauricus]|nr:hypothetical protein GCM10010372_59540 [Streptomyces tauricus]
MCGGPDRDAKGEAQKAEVSYERGADTGSATDGAGLPAQIDMAPLHERDTRARVISGRPHDKGRSQ